MPFEVTPENRAQFEEDGFFVVRGFVGQEDVAAIKARIAAALDAGALENVRFDAKRADGHDLQGPGKFRKVASFARNDRTVWGRFIANENQVRVHRAFLGDDVRLWFDSIFTKPARIGEATPWHQDIGLWTYRPETKAKKSLYRDAVSVWMALDPATRQNGCLQVLPGSHRGDVVDHVQYDEGAIHPELPRDLVAGIDPAHVELRSGDAIVWHAHLWHYSPPNLSDGNRWGIACVTLRDADARAAGLDHLPWLLRNGEVNLDEVRDSVRVPGR